VTINWQLYSKLDNFTLREAAALWLETSPDSEHPGLEMMERLLNQTLVKIKLESFGENEEEAYNRVFTLICFNRYSSGNTTPDFPVKKGSGKGIIPASGSDIAKIKNSAKEYRFSSISRSDLIKIANELNHTPKFLFPESRQTNTSTLEDSLQPKKRNSYLKLIKGLLHKQGIDPGERGIAKRLVGMVKDAKQTLGDDAILVILKEIQQLDEDGCDRKYAVSSD
jgi:hypothetical protein